MEASKKWYESKGVWGGVISVIAIILGVFGYNITPEDQQTIVASLAALGATVGSIVAVVGRVKATKQIK